MTALKKLGIATVMAALAIGLLAPAAHAWGPRAQRGIATTSLQLLRRTMPNALQNRAVNYEGDVVRGSQTAPDAVRGYPTNGSDDEILNFIGTEIQLLRAVRTYGAGSFFAYRVGVLGTVVADSVLPFAHSRASDDQRLLKRIEEDIDERASGFTFIPEETELYYVRDPKDYLQRRRSFREDAQVLIRGDYASGTGYNGLLKQGAETFFRQAIQAVADVWFTVMRVEAESTDVSPSTASMTWYFVDEIDYLLMVKGNFQEAEQAYTSFAGVNPGILPAYEAVGDLFYEFGQKERGVLEWKIALNITGPSRVRILEKLASHYLSQGKELLAKVGQADAPRNVLDDALLSFETSFGYSRDIPETSELIAQTKQAIVEREKRRAEASKVLASGEKKMTEAQSAASQTAYANAITTYQNAIEIFSGVSDEFDDYLTIAQNDVAKCNQAIQDIIGTIIENAHNTIEEGNRMLEDANFEGARQKYDTVKTVLNELPAGTKDEDKQNLIEESEKKKSDVSVAEQRFKEREQRKQQREQQAKEAAEAAARARQQGGGTAASGTPAPR